MQVRRNHRHEDRHQRRRGESNPEYLTDVGGTLYFSAYDGTDTELWKYDGTTATKIDVNAGTGSSILIPDQRERHVYFRAYRRDGHGTLEVRRHDGDQDRHQRRHRAVPTLDLTDVDGTLYFRATTARTRSSGSTTARPRRRSTSIRLRRSDPNDLTNVGGTLYFARTTGRIRSSGSTTAPRPPRSTSTSSGSSSPATSRP